MWLGPGITGCAPTIVVGCSGAWLIAVILSAAEVLQGVQ